MLLMTILKYVLAPLDPASPSVPTAMSDQGWSAFHSEPVSDPSGPPNDPAHCDDLIELSLSRPALASEATYGPDELDRLSLTTSVPGASGRPEIGRWM